MLGAARFDLHLPSMSVVTRFAPSPTGFLHIGGARTALFNWLFARRMGGQYLLRIEDTDRARSTPEAIEAILDGLGWLGLEGDGQTIYQFARAGRHAEAAHEMIERGTAFRCYVTQNELAEYREAGEKAREHLRMLETIRQKRSGDRATRETETRENSTREFERLGREYPDIEAAIVEAKHRLTKFLAYRSPYRDGLNPPSPNAPFVVRLRAPDAGEIVNDDLVQGTVKVAARDIDDLVMLRADGTPTYMLSVVVDDHDMGVTHIIRGDDHLTNAARQIPIYQAMGWSTPKFAHLPLIHGQDGAKLSKRHGALGVGAYRDMGYLPEGLASYLMRLGWSPGHDDILSKDDAIAQFDIAQIGKAPARLDIDKLNSVNAHFLKQADDERVTRLFLDYVASQHKDWAPSPAALARLAKAAPALKSRAKTFADMAAQARFLVLERPLSIDAKSAALLKDFKDRLKRLHDHLRAGPVWENAALSTALKTFASEEGVGLGQIGPGLRAALTGGAPAPDLGQSLELLGRDEALARIADQI